MCVLPLSKGYPTCILIGWFGYAHGYPYPSRVAWVRAYFTPIPIGWAGLEVDPRRPDCAHLLLRLLVPFGLFRFGTSRICDTFL